MILRSGDPTVRRMRDWTVLRAPRPAQGRLQQEGISWCRTKGSRDAVSSLRNHRPPNKSPDVARASSPDVARATAAAGFEPNASPFSLGQAGADRPAGRARDRGRFVRSSRPFIPIDPGASRAAAIDRAQPGARERTARAPAEFVGESRDGLVRRACPRDGVAGRAAVRGQGPSQPLRRSSELPGRPSEPARGPSEPPAGDGRSAAGRGAQ
jgi:hypothetical protein